MITVKDPRQTGLFDKFADVLPPKIRRVLDDRWEGVFRTMILELMPIEAMSQRLCVDNGRPSHELYAMCGLIMMKEYRLDFRRPHDQGQRAQGAKHFKQSRTDWLRHATLAGNV